MKVLHWVRLVLPTVVGVVIAGCRADEGAVTASTGVGESSDSREFAGAAAVVPPVPTAAELHGRAVADLARQAGLEVDLARAGKEAICALDLDYEPATGRIAGTETWRWVHDGPALERIAFRGRTIGDSGGPEAGAAVERATPRVTAITLDGVAMAVPQDEASVYNLAHRLEAGQAIEVAFRFELDLPLRKGDIASDPGGLEGALGLARAFGAGDFEGRREGAFGGTTAGAGSSETGEVDPVVVLAGLPILRTDAAGARFHLVTAIRTTGDYRAVANGVEIGRERSGVGRVTRFVALDAWSAALVIGRGWTEREVQVAHTSVLVLSRASPDSAGWASRVRRALETLEDTWGRCPEARLTVVEVGTGYPGVAALPGILLVSRGLAPLEGIKDMPALTEVVTRHPARDETMGFELAAGVARQWWVGRGADAAAENLLSFGLGTAGALRVIGTVDGDKVRRHALEVSMHMPFQAGDAGAESVLAKPSVASDSRHAQLKAGFWAERLERQLGQAAFQTAVRALRASTTPIDVAALRSAFLAQAAQPDETRAFMARWLDEAHAGEDIGALDPGVLMEYLVVDGAVNGIKSELLKGPVGPKLLQSLGAGKGLDPALAIDALEGVVGAPSDPKLKAVMDLGRLVLGNDPDTKKAVTGQLVDEIGIELGISPAERARLRVMAGLALDALNNGTSDVSKPRVQGDEGGQDRTPAPP